MSSTIPDLEFDYYGSFGFTGHKDDRELAWLQSEGATSNDIKDAWYEFLAIQGFVGAIKDSKYEWLYSLSYRGHVNDMWHDYLQARIGYINDIIAIAGKPLVWLNDQTLEFTVGNELTAWRNDPVNATGGVDYDVFPVLGILNVLNIGNGILAIRNNGTGNMRSTLAQVINQPCTVYITAKADNIPAANKYIMAGFDTATALFIFHHNTLVWRASSGAIRSVGASDLDINIHSAIVNGASSNYKVVNTNDQVTSGNLGANPLQYISLLSNQANGTLFDGWIADLKIYNGAHTVEQQDQIIAAMQAHIPVGPS